MSAELRIIPSQEQAGDIRTRLLEMLVLARRGELSSIAIAYVDRDGQTGCSFSHSPSTASLVGSIEAMKHHVVADWMSA